MEHEIPDVPLNCLQAILRELIRARDPDPIFIVPEAEPVPVPDPASLGR